MSVLLGKPDCVHADQLLQPSSVFLIRLYILYIMCCVVDLGILSSADGWAQLCTKMDSVLAIEMFDSGLMSVFIGQA